jgi:hypothetical protein
MSSITSALFASLLFVCIAMSVGSAGMVGGFSPVAPNGESVERNSHFAAQQVNMRVNSFQHKKLINIHSAEAQVVAGVKYRLVFDIATTTCRKNSNEDPATCNEFNKDMVSKLPLFPAAIANRLTISC